MFNRFYQIAEIKLSYKNKPDIASRPVIAQSKDAYAVLVSTWDEDQIGHVEQAKVLLLNQSNRVLGVYEWSTGGVTETVCDPKLVFAAALKANACNIILAHNHPSENLTPSCPDKTLTEKIKQAGETMDIKVLDHLIVSPSGYYSFSDDASYRRQDLHLDMDEEKTSKKKKLTLAAEDQPVPVTSVVTYCATYLQKEIVERALLRSSLAYDALLATWQDNTLDIQQTFKMFCLDEDCSILSLHTMPQQMRFDSYRDAEFLVSLAAKEEASFIVLAQNKPYGVILPKIADLDFSEMLNVAGRGHDITLLDYLFINKNGYYSYNDNEFHLTLK